MTERRRFIFIAGAEGSGTTLLLRLLSRPDECWSLGGNYTKLPDDPAARALAEEFESAHRALCDRKSSFLEHDEARRRWQDAIAGLRASPFFGEEAHIVFKRSSPFALPREQRVPDLWDAIDLLPDAPLLVIYRDPRAATFSTFRRGFDTDLRRLAVVCAEQLTRLAAQVTAIGPERCRIVDYQELCSKPVPVLRGVADFCGLSREAMQVAAQAEAFDATTNLRFIEELDAKDSAWLDGFFDERRRRQWAALPDAAARFACDCIAHPSPRP